jgi:hypothetical protein
MEMHVDDGFSWPLCERIWDEQKREKNGSKIPHRMLLSVIKMAANYFKCVFRQQEGGQVLPGSIFGGLDA